LGLIFSHTKTSYEQEHIQQKESSHRSQKYAPLSQKTRRPKLPFVDWILLKTYDRKLTN
jgi:hypothetical protein